MLFVVQEEKISASKKKRRLKEETRMKNTRAEGISLRMQDSFRFSFVHFYCLIVTEMSDYMLDGFFLLFAQ